MSAFAAMGLLSWIVMGLLGGGRAGGRGDRPRCGSLRGLRCRRLSHDLRRRQWRAGGGGPRAGDPASDGLPALRTARKALDAADPARIGRLSPESFFRRLRRDRLRWALPALASAGDARRRSTLRRPPPRLLAQLLGRGEQPTGLRALRSFSGRGA